MFKRRKPWPIRTAWLALIGVAGCVPWGGGVEASVEPGALGATHWIDVDALQDRPPVSLVFQDPHMVSGFAGCNRYSSPVLITQKSWQFQRVTLTRMLCEPEAMDTEQRYLKALDATRAARMNKAVLELLDGQGKVLWRFKPLG